MLKEILTSNNIVESINNYMDYLLVVIPELKSIIKFPHKNPGHHLDVWNHTLYALSFSENDFEIRLCLLLHDIGKPFSYQDGDGNIRHFHGHAMKSAMIAKEILDRFDYDEDFKEEVYYLILKHDTPITEDDIKNNPELSRKRYKIQVCDSLAHNPSDIKRRTKYLSKIKSMIKANR